MLFSQLSIIAALVMGAIAVPAVNTPAIAAVPSPGADVAVKAKRATEGVHLVNCGSSTSDVVYCPNDGDCNHQPSSENVVVLQGIRTWEGGNFGVTFSSGVSFSWNIRSDAQSQPNFSQVGTGSNGFHNFNCFKDNKHIMFSNCASIYYCLDA